MQKTATQKWMTDEILEKMEERRKCKNTVSNQQHKKLTREIDKMCLEARTQFWEEKCAEVEALESTHQYK